MRKIPELHEARTPSPQRSRYVWGIALLLCVFVCALFAAMASWTLLFQLKIAGFQEETGFYTRLLVKALLFTLLLAGATVALKKLPRLRPQESVPLPENNSVGYTRLLQGLAVLLTLLLIFPNLAAYPWTGPDELHHLIVSKNLAESGAYASGHPETGLTYFDAYDSVGSPVIAPIALAFRVADTDFVYGRILIACFYLALCIEVYLLVVPVFGAAAAASAVLLMTAAFGTVYFARSVYGEVPAMTFLIGGLLLWRAALKQPNRLGVAIAAGALFGLAVLTKAFILVSACAFLGLFLFDRMHSKSLPWRPNLWTAVGLFGTVALWAAVEAAFARGAEENASLLVYYRHYLMFGLDSAATGIGWLLARPLTLALTLAAGAAAIRLLFEEHEDPALTVLLLIAVLFVFWWIFFTPGNIPRYMWYSAAIAGIFSGILLERMRQIVAQPAFARIPKSLATAVIVAILSTSLLRIAPEIEKVYGHDQMVGEMEMVDFVNTLPAETKLATTYWAASRSVTFFTDKPVDIVDDVELARKKYDVIIMDSYTETIPPRVALDAPRVGRYVIVSDAASAPRRTEQ